MSRLVVRVAKPPRAVLHRATAEAGSHELCPFNHRFKFAEGKVTREILHAAVGRDCETLRRNMLQRGLDARGDGVGRLDISIRKVEYAHDRYFTRKIAEYCEVKARLGGFDRNLVDDAAFQFGQE